MALDIGKDTDDLNSKEINYLKYHSFFEKIFHPNSDEILIFCCFAIYTVLIVVSYYKNYFLLTFLLSLGLFYYLYGLLTDKRKMLFSNEGLFVLAKFGLLEKKYSDLCGFIFINNNLIIFYPNEVNINNLKNNFDDNDISYTKLVFRSLTSEEILYLNNFFNDKLYVLSQEEYLKLNKKTFIRQLLVLISLVIVICLVLFLILGVTIYYLF